jgi:hypothetical protein
MPNNRFAGLYVDTLIWLKLSKSLATPNRWPIWRSVRRHHFGNLKINWRQNQCEQSFC